jgi:hypothetical protein
VPSYNQDDAPHFWLNGQDQAAIDVLDSLPPRNAIGLRHRAIIHAAQGLYTEAADALLEMPAGIYLPDQVEQAVRLLRTAPRPAASPQSLPRLGGLGFAYLHVGAADRYLEFLEETVQGGYWGALNTAVLWHPAYASVRKTERFKAYVRNTGLVDYWRAKGWPEFCRPVGADDFTCD